VCILCALSLCYSIYNVRMRRVTSLMKARFSERLNERTRIASALHDTLLQTISGTKLAADAALAGVSDVERTRISLERISVWLERASLEVRAALESLHAPPSEATDLPAALASAAREAGAHRPMEVFMSVTGTPRVLNEVARDEIYMIGYEAIRNAHNHSAGTRLMIQITYNHSLILCIADNGHGMGSSVLQAGKPGHYGLGGMRKRAARIGADLDFSSSATGTVVTLTVPPRSAFSR
jgi:signal transduction histidine kinase